MNDKSNPIAHIYSLIMLALIFLTIALHLPRRGIVLWSGGGKRDWEIAW
jgi:hypothetical protein